ncbi:hypothetical protein AHF37_00899 [Paragonimus kellicotti]|nr:hypothetical protein AHF37_00899 [Paragonimus kellicotti]
MSNIKLWSVLLPIVLTCMNYEKVVKAYKDVILDDDLLFGGFVGMKGCLYEDVCFESELCFNDQLFGKCVSRLNTSSEKMMWKISVLNALENVFYMFPEGIDWNDMHVQCLLRTILQNKSNQLTETELKALCGVQPVIAAEAPDNEEAEYSLLRKRMFDSDDPMETFLNNNHARLSPLYSVTQDVTPASSLFNEGALSAKLEQTLQNNRIARRRDHPDSKDHTDDEIKQILAQFQLLGNKPNRYIELRPANRFYNKHSVHTSPEDVKQSHLGTATNSPSSVEALPKRRYQLSLSRDIKPPIPPTRSWIWAKFIRRSLDAYEAEYFLQELSRRMDRTGNVLYFQVPKATGISTESVVQALKDGKGNFDSYQIEHVGFGRAAPLYQSTASTNSTKNYPATLAICLAIVSVFVLLVVSYIVCVCYRKWQNKRDEKASNTAVLIDIEHSGSRRRQSSQKSVIDKIKQFFESKINMEKSQLQKNKQLLPESLAPPGEHTNNQSRSLHITANTGGLWRVIINATINLNVFMQLAEAAKMGVTQLFPAQPDKENCPERYKRTRFPPHKVAHRPERRTVSPGKPSVELLESSGSMWAVRRRQIPEHTNKTVIPSGSSSQASKYGHDFNHDSCAYTDIFMLSESSEPVSCGIDLTTGHLILTYMEEFLRDAGRLVEDWEAVNAYEAEEATPCADAQRPENLLKNRITAPLPCPLGIGTQLARELRGSVAILEKFGDLGDKDGDPVSLPHLGRWELEIKDHFHPGIQKKSESRFSCHDEPNCCSLPPYNRYKNNNLLFKTTQLEYFPFVFHSDGSGRSGTYILLDLVITRIVKGVKEINIAASLEHLRDQRQNMVQSKEQYEFVFTAVAQEVDGMLKATGQNS